MKYALKLLIFLKCIFEFMINTAPWASNSVCGREKLFWYDKINFSNHMCYCGAVVKRFLKRADKPGSTPVDVVFCFLYRFFFLFGLFFWHYFSFWPFFLYSYCWPCWSCTLINIYFKLESGVLFWKKTNTTAFVHSLNHQYYYPKISTGSVAPQK